MKKGIFVRKFLAVSLVLSALLGAASCRSEFDDENFDTGYVKNLAGKWRGKRASLECSGDCRHNIDVWHILEVSEKTVEISDIEYESEDSACECCQNEIENYYKKSLFKDEFGKVFSVALSNSKKIVLEGMSDGDFPKTETREFYFWREQGGLKVLINGNYVYFSPEK